MLCSVSIFALLLFRFCAGYEPAELRQGAETISVMPQMLDLQKYLTRNRECVVSKDELIAGIWNGRVVSDAALTRLMPPRSQAATRARNSS